IINTIDPTLAAYFGWAGVTSWAGAVSPLDFNLAIPVAPPSGFSSLVVDTVDIQTSPSSAPAVTTAQLPPNTAVGGMIVDQATVTGLVNPLPGDTVTFNLYSSATVQDNTTLLYSNTQTLTLNGGTGTATSGAYTTAATGTDYWVATFNGDSANAI